MHWTSEGEGPVVVLLHGLGGDASFWAAEVAALSDSFRVLTVDLPGSGGTPIPDPSIATFADQVCTVLDEAGIGTAHVVGFSMGGLVAQVLAARYPDRVDKLVLASTYSVMNAQARLFLDAVRDIVVSSGSLRAVFPLVRPWLFSIDFLADPANAALLEAPEEDDDPAGWLAQYQAQRDFNGRITMAVVAAPTLVLSGAEDRLVSAADALELTAGIPTASLTTYASAGHLINVEAPDHFAADIRTFLTA